MTVVIFVLKNVPVVLALQCFTKVLKSITHETRKTYLSCVYSSAEQRKTFVSVINDINNEHRKELSILGPCFSKICLEENVIEELSNNLEKLFTVKDIMENFPIPEMQVA